MDKDNSLPFRKDVYRVDYYDEFNNEVRTAYLQFPLYAYLNDRDSRFIPAYRDDEPVSIPIACLVKDYHDEGIAV